MRLLKRNYALFDYFEYVPYEYSMKPIIEGQLPPEPEGTTTRWDFDEEGVIPAGMDKCRRKRIGWFLEFAERY